MHHATLKAAIAKYGPLHTEGKTEEEIREEISADEKGFTEEEVSEIYTAITSDDGGSSKKSSSKMSKADAQKIAITSDDGGSSKKSSSKMSKADAQKIVDKYSGINGVGIPDELKQAREVLREK